MTTSVKPHVLMTAQERDEAQKRCQQATPNWTLRDQDLGKHDRYFQIMIGRREAMQTIVRELPCEQAYYDEDKANIELAFHARTDLPRALGDLAVLHSLVGELVKMIDKVPHRKSHVFGTSILQCESDCLACNIRSSHNAALARARVIQGGESA